MTAPRLYQVLRWVGYPHEAALWRSGWALQMLYEQVRASA